MSLDMEDHRIRYEGALAAFREAPDDDGAMLVLEYFIDLWRARNKSTVGIDAALDELDEECSAKIREARKV